MDVWQVMRARHSVRAYEHRPLPQEIAEKLREEVEQCNREGGLSIRLVTGEPKAFSGFLAHYGKFSGVENYFVLAERRGKDLDERAGYYGERLVLFAQSLGLNTCWAALTFSRRAAKEFAHLKEGEKLVCVIALGYGKTQGTPHRGKTLSEVCAYATDADRNGAHPAWFLRGAEAAILAPTAVNQQKFLFTLTKDGVRAQQKGGFCRGIDLGIVKYHFELGAGRENFEWV